MRFRRVLAHAEKRLDAQVLFDPFEKEFDRPAAFIELRDGQCRKRKIVGEVALTLGRFRVVENDGAQILRRAAG